MEVPSLYHIDIGSLSIMGSNEASLVVLETALFAQKSIFWLLSLVLLMGYATQNVELLLKDSKAFTMAELNKVKESVAENEDADATDSDDSDDASDDESDDDDLFRELSEDSDDDEEDSDDDMDMHSNGGSDDDEDDDDDDDDDDEEDDDDDEEDDEDDEDEQKSVNPKRMK